MKKSFVIPAFVLVALVLGCLFYFKEDLSRSKHGSEYDLGVKTLLLFSNRIPVIVDIKDTSNIAVPDRHSPEFNSKLIERENTLLNISNSVLSTLSEKEFQLGGKLISGQGFYGNITKEGFDKLLQDNRVDKINDNRWKGRIST